MASCAVLLKAADVRLRRSHEETMHLQAWWRACWPASWTHSRWACAASVAALISVQDDCGIKAWVGSPWSSVLENVVW